MKKIEQIRQLMKKNNLDAFLIFGGEHNGFNRFWTYGLESSAGFGIVTHTESLFLIDDRYYEMAKEKVNNAEVIRLISKDDLFTLLSKTPGTRIGIEAEYTTTAFYKNLQDNLLEKQIIITATSDLRIRKTKEEVKIIKEACAITEEVLEKLYKWVKPGMTELEVKTFLAVELIKLGGSGLEFEIVASGKRGALPHGRASSKKIEKGDMVTIDFGTRYKNYCSDITRNFVMGERCSHEQLVEIHEIVKEAQRLGVESIKPGMRVSDVDSACREYIKSKGYGDKFVHSTGHGLGIEVHEAPAVSSRFSTILEPGMVITVEPGIYIPGLGGVRIEDDVLVTESGFEILNNSSKELKYIK